MAVLKNHIQVTLNELEENLSTFKLKEYIQECEDDFDRQILDIAKTVVDNENIRAIFISGPTASGKTTFNYKLGKALNNNGIDAVSMSLDDYYFSHKFKTDTYGRHDYESIDTLDVELILSQIRDLVAGNTVIIPRFDFLTKTRIEDKSRETKLPDRGVLIVEGLHGLSSSISGAINEDQWFGVFIMPYATLNDDYRLLDSRDVRILRRVARDALNRGSDPLATIDYWPMLDLAEQTNFSEYLMNADVYVNSAMSYEFYCVAPFAGAMISKSLSDYESGVTSSSRLTSNGGFAQIDLALEEARRLSKAACRIPSIGLDKVPPGSLLNEFIHTDTF